MSRARECTSQKMLQENPYLSRTAYNGTQSEYSNVGKRYEEELRIKPDFYEALGQQQFEQAKFSCYYAIGKNVDLETWPSEEILHLYNNAEENIDRGMQMWEELEGQRLRELSKSKKEQNESQKMGSYGLFKNISTEAGCPHKCSDKHFMGYHTL
ncbi:hypothetical protein DITRI_Ditri07aG0035300 [Diplodiscus trichospermus]